MKPAQLHTFLGLLVLLPLMAAAQVGGENPPLRQHPFLMLWDRDGDGQLSEAEIGNAPAVLRRMDDDGDGKLTVAEIRAAMQKPLAKRAARGPGSPGSNQLARAGLKAGLALPDVKILDADGQEFVLSNLKGHYTVLVFGCLT